MNSFHSIKAKLEPLGIYDLNAQNITNELTVYSEELDRLKSRSDTMLKEAFLSTADSYGLSELESIFGRVRSNMTISKRRKLLSDRFSLSSGDFTLSGIKKALDSFNLNYTVSEYPALMKLNIIADTDYPASEQEWIRKEAEKIIPANIEFQIVFNTISWSELDAKNKTFSTLDSENLTWKSIDAMTE